MQILNDIKPQTPNDILRNWLNSLPHKAYQKVKLRLAEECLVPMHTLNNWIYGKCVIRPASQRDINRVSIEITGNELFTITNPGVKSKA